jgi:hypothetical protein
MQQPKAKISFFSRGPVSVDCTVKTTWVVVRAQMVASWKRLDYPVTPSSAKRSLCAKRYINEETINKRDGKKSLCRHSARAQSDADASLLLSIST